MDYIVKILRTLFFNIDRVVYEGIGNVYDLLLSIARTSIFNSNTIEGFYEKIYALIGIFMLFKISFSLITYILNPDDFSDKEKGFSSIIKRVVMSLVMLVLVPYGFQEAYELQTIILEDNTLAALVFDTGVDNDEEATYKIDTAGDKIKFILMYTFFQPNYNEIYEEDGNVAISSCAVTYQHKSDGSIEVNNGVFKLNSDCFGNFVDSESMEYDDSGAFASYWKDKDLYQTYVQGVARQNFYLMFKHDIAMMQVKDKEIYIVDYMAPLSTAVGIAVLWVLLLFCIDVAVRSVKLGFYELIAPIPILSYIDPKTKDGMLSKWFKQVSTTYLSLFMRLLALYLAIFIIYSVSQNGIADVVTGERITDWWVIIFVIIGVLMFAKQLPKILEDTLGIKGTGDFTLNPLKKLEDGMIGGKTVSKAAKVGIGTAKGVGTAALVGGAGLVTGQGLRFGAMGKAIAGGARGEKFGKNFASSYGAGRARKKQLDQMKADGVSPWAVRGDKLYNAFHGETRSERVKHASDGMKALQNYYESYEKTAVGVDAYAKYADKQAKAAAARGDYAATKSWEDARDKRVKEIHESGGKVSNAKDVKETDFFAVDAKTGQIDYSRRHSNTNVEASSVSSDPNAALSNLASSMTNLANALNQRYDGVVEGYQRIETVQRDSHGNVIKDANGNDLLVDPKAMKNAALGSQQSIDTNAVNVGIHDTAKYSGGSKK